MGKTKAADIIIRIEYLEAEFQKKLEKAMATIEENKMSKIKWIHHLENCARCGGTHTEIEMRKFSQNPPDGYGWWALCPANGEPILVKVEEKRFGEFAQLQERFTFDPDNPPWAEPPSAPPEMHACNAQGFSCDYELQYCECNTPLFYECRNCGNIWDGPEWEQLTGSCPICDEIVFPKI